MKLINPILITLNNTLHIKADNLEPVQVEEKAAREIKVCHLDYTIFSSKAYRNKIDLELKQGIPLPQELSDRIEVRDKVLTIIDNKWTYVKRAFLLPEKDEVKEMYVIVFNNGHKNYVGMNIHDSIDNCYEAIGLSYDTKHLGIYKLVKVN